MKRSILWALVLCVAGAQVHAQSIWQWQYPQPQGNDLNAVDIWGTATAIAVGNNGAVVKSIDGGAMWAFCPTVAGMPSLRGVSLLDAVTVVAVGDGGVILRSVNLGATWVEAVSGTPNTLLAVDFTDALHGVAVGANGVILRSDDAGVTWTLQSSGTSAMLRDVCVVDVSTAIAVGSAGTILRTDDGGSNWVSQDGGTPAVLHAVDFFSNTIGKIAGYGPIVLSTNDGGANWTEELAWPGYLAPTDLYGLDVLGTLMAVAVGEDAGAPDPSGLVVRTGNGGVSWSTSSAPSVLNDVAMFSGNQGVAVGAAGVIRRTTDGGATWNQVGGGGQRFSMQSVEFYDLQHGIAASLDNGGNTPTSRIYLTSDGGASWTVSQPFAWSQVYDVAYADVNTIYAVGRGPAVMDAGAWIWRSTDGGATWADLWGSDCYGGDQNLHCIPVLKAVDFAGPGAGVAVGQPGAQGNSAFAIINGVVQGMGGHGNGVSVPTPQRAYAVGNMGVMFKYDLSNLTPLPLTWTGVFNTLCDVCFVDDMTGWMLGSSGLLLHTTDGGTNWIFLSCPWGTSMSFIDEFNGVMSDGGTTIWKTIDGGSTWLPETTPSPVSEVAFIDMANMVAVGGNENIIVRRDIPVPVFFQDVSASVKNRSVEVRWAVYTDEAIQGYRVYRDDVAVTTDLIAPAEHTFLDGSVAPDTEYRYVIAAVGESGTETRSWPVTVRLPAAPVVLHQNTPNPFNPVTEIRFAVPVPMHVTLAVYDILGRRVALLADRVFPGGEHAVKWDGQTGAGNPAASGIYFYEMRTPKSTMVRKMALLK